MDCINKDKNFHFIAIGGVGMSGLAKYLLEEGYSVSGSDISESKYFNKIKKLGAKVFLGHNEANLPQNSIVIASTAIKPNNPELQKAKKNNMKILHRSDLLKFIAENFQQNNGKFIGFSGTHGKTTTSGLAAYVMEKAGLNPSYVVGGIIPELDTNAKFSSGKFFTAELDESDGTILKYSPDIIVINNLETDHIDFYKNGLDSLLSTFSTFLSSLKNNAQILINKDCEGTQKLINNNPQTKFITYSINSQADYIAKNIVYDTNKTSFNIYKNNAFLCKLNISIPGKHNVYNALSVAAALIEAGIDIKEIADCFTTFTGMGRRYQQVAEFDNITIIDDYAHHPSEIAATLECAKSCNPQKHLIAIFQPHRYTRLNGLYNEFLNCFTNADKVIVLDTFAASETPINGHNSQEFANDLNKKLKKDVAKYIGGKISDVIPAISKELLPGDLAITLGAGDVTKVGNALAEFRSKYN